VIVIAGEPQEAVHAGSDDRQPPCGAFLFTFVFAVLLPILSKLSCHSTRLYSKLFLENKHQASSA